MVRYPDAGCFSVGEHDFGNHSGSRQHKGIRTGQQPFHIPVGDVGHLGISGDVFQVRTDKTERFFWIALFDGIHLFNGFFVHDIASDTVKCISGIGDDASFFKDSYNL